MKEPLANVSQVKERNVYMVKTALRGMGEGTKQSVALSTGLSVTTCNSILNELYEAGEVILVGDSAGKSIGRPAKSYALDKDFEYVCCLYPFVDEKSSFFHYAVMDRIGGVVEESNVACEGRAWIEIEALLSSLIIKHPKIRTVCIGIAGYSDNDMWLSSRFFTSFNEQDVVGKLSESLGRKIIVENDMNAIAYGIYRSGFCEPDQAESMIVISCFESTGIGAGTVYRGHIMHGFRNFAGELGWLPAFGGKVNARLEEGHDAAIDCMVNCIQAVASVLNPQACALIGERLQADDVPRILDRCRARMPESALPRLAYFDHYHDFFIDGLYSIALEYILGGGDAM